MSSRLPASTILASLLLAAAAPSAQSKVWVVDASGGGDFLDLEPAVQTAAPGDTLLVRSGVYGATSISKALSVIAESGVQPQGLVWTRFGFQTPRCCTLDAHNPL